MRQLPLALIAAVISLAGCSGATSTNASTKAAAAPVSLDGVYRGFDRNLYPGDTTMAAMHGTFAFTGYWLTNPPGETTNTWLGKRSLLKNQGWGFLVLSDGRLDAEILKAQKHGNSPSALGQQDAAIAIASAKSEGFPSHTILFLDQEEGGSLLAEQSAYLLAWTEAVAASSYNPGVYASGQPVANGKSPDGKPLTITTIGDIRSKVIQGHLHNIAFFDAQDTCPPAPGCTLHAKSLATSGEPNLTAWQYAQSPRRPELTKSCAATYSAPVDGQSNCYAPDFPTIFLDMDAANTPDPSRGR